MEQMKECKVVGYRIGIVDKNFEKWANKNPYHYQMKNFDELNQAIQEMLSNGYKVLSVSVTPVIQRGTRNPITEGAESSGRAGHVYVTYSR